MMAEWFWFIVEWFFVGVFFFNGKEDKKWLHFNYLISLRQKEECREKVQPLKERPHCNMNRHI